MKADAEPEKKRNRKCGEDEAVVDMEKQDKRLQGSLEPQTGDSSKKRKTTGGSQSDKGHADEDHKDVYEAEAERLIQELLM